MEENFGIAQRVELLVDRFAEGVNTRFAELVGTSEANIRNYKNGKLPKLDFVCSVCDSLEINYEWLLSGKGEMMRSAVVKNSISEPDLFQNSHQLASVVNDSDGAVKILTETNRLLVEANVKLANANLILAETNAQLSQEVLRSNSNKY